MESRYTDALDDCYREIVLIEEHVNLNKFDSFNQFLISYSVIKACGVIEVVYKNLIVDKISVGATQEAKSYIEKYIRDSSSNPSTGNIMRLLQDLNICWCQEFDSKVKGQNEKGSLSSLVGLRNDFAHGKSVTASIGNVRKYFEDSRSILLWLVNTPDRTGQ